MLVFVYGTLLKANRNHQAYLKNAHYSGQAVLHDYALYDLGSYPGILSKKNELVLGEVYDINEQTLARLNVLEGEGDLYLLTEVEVSSEDGSVITVYTYIYNRSVDVERKISIDQMPYKDD